MRADISHAHDTGIKMATTYTTEPDSHCVYATGPDGIKRVFAGSEHSYGKNDGPQASATFHSPYGIVVLPDGTLVVVDTSNSCIRTIKHGFVATMPLEFVKQDLWDPRLNSLLHPTGIGLRLVPDSRGALHPEYVVADTDNDVIRLIRDNKVHTIVGAIKHVGTREARELGEHTTLVRLDSPTDVYCDDTACFFTDTGSLFKIGSDGTCKRVKRFLGGSRDPSTIRTQYIENHSMH
jgi:hypothetical protein